MDASPEFLPDMFYHVYNRANANERLFHRHENYRFFMMKLYSYLPAIGTLYCYALLPNHFHLLIKTHKKSDYNLNGDQTVNVFVSKAFSNFFNSYTRNYNLFYRRRGVLFSRSFKRKQVDNISYLKNVILYIHRNPVQHNVCDQIDSWSYTSHHLLVHQPEDIIHREILNWFGGLKEYCSYMGQPVMILPHINYLE